MSFFFSCIANLKCTPSDRQMYPLVYMYPRLGTFVLERQEVYMSQATFFVAVAAYIQHCI